MSCARYSSAASPTADALTRSGMSLVTRMTRPAGRSLARFNAQARMRESLLSLRNPAGSTVASVWLSSTCRVPPGGAGRHRSVQPAVFDPQLVQQPQRLPGEIAELGMVPLGLQLTDDDQRQDHLVFVEAVQRPGIGQQNGGVDDVGAARAADRRRLPATARCRPVGCGEVLWGRPVCDHNGSLADADPRIRFLEVGRRFPATRPGAVPAGGGPGPDPLVLGAAFAARTIRGLPCGPLGALPTFRTVPPPVSRSGQTRKTTR